MARDTATGKKAERGDPPALHPDPEKHKALRAFRKYGTVKAAARAVDVHRSTLYRWALADPEFAAALKEAADDVTDDLEREALTRAKKGSDTLLIFLLKTRARDRYGDRPAMQGKQIPVEEFEEFLHELAQAVERAARSSIPEAELRVKHLDAVGYEWMALLAARYPDIAATVRHGSDDRREPAPVDRQLPPGE